MIQSLSNRYKSHAAWMMFVIFYIQLLFPGIAAAKSYGNYAVNSRITYYRNSNNLLPANPVLKEAYNANKFRLGNPAINKMLHTGLKKITKINALQKPLIGGPVAPEASSFKAVGSNNLVNLSTGDFSYSIPLLDVGGYPVNLFYAAGVGMEQEASWVGLGWNINPGTVNRNMRGIPDDFNGTDSLTQTQNVKPNRTWGGELGEDVELIGLKTPDLSIGLGTSIGFSYNNYLGPALEIGNKVSLSLSISENVKGDKSAPASLGLKAALGAKLSSRSGLTFSPSLNANLSILQGHVQAGVGLSTSYNSRTGIKDLNIHSEVKMSQSAQKYLDRNNKEQTGGGAISMPIGSTTISFAKPSYLPALRMPMQNTNFSGQIEVGASYEGVRLSGTAQGYYSESIVPDEFKTMYKPLVGYIYAENAMKNPNAVMDFNRLGDAAVTPNTPIISAPQYNYDIFTIQGEGTGGSIRAYRGDMGFVRDNVTTSKEKNVSVGVDVAPGFHFGLNVNVIKTPTRVGGWEDGNNKLKLNLAFKPKQINNSFENVYFKNPGESTVSNIDLINKVGRDNLVRFKLGGSKNTTTLEAALEQFDKNTISNIDVPLAINNNINSGNRDKRTQVITMLNAEDATNIGLDKNIENIDGSFDGQNNIIKQPFSRIDGIKKRHHISEIDVLEKNGMRYVYGLPVYNVKQKDFTFSVNALPAKANDNLVSYTATEPFINSEHMNNNANLDGYVQTQQTPGYASSFMLTGLLSPDYVDVTNNGITEDDLGSAVKFGYNKSSMNHKWRTPRNNTSPNLAHFNEGIRSEKKDNKAAISYGEREVWYLSTIESKAMIAIFKTAIRNDAKGVNGELDGQINTAENANKRLVQIDLYTKSEIKTKGYANARPIKSVVFNYDYSLCNGTPDNLNGGKLTLKSIYFSYNGQPKSNKDRYVFNYGNLNSQKDNPNYSYNASDRWGTYKPALDSMGVANNISGLSNLDYPYTLNGVNDKAKDDMYAGAWSLKKILLPSGGQMEVEYEADDYGYVQNRRACNMMSIAGLGKSPDYTANSSMYIDQNIVNDNNYVFVQLKQPLISTTPDKQKNEIFAKYFDGMNQVSGKPQLVVKLQVYMPKGLEPLTIYPEYDDYGVCPNNSNYLYVHLKTVDGISPLVNSSLGFLTENIPGQAFDGYAVDVDGIDAFIKIAGAMLKNLSNAFKNVNQQMRAASPSKGRDISLANSFIRLANPTKTKYGGGIRVKSVKVRDNWNKMKDQYVSVYGQDYDYATIENINGLPTTISSGVASYEPGIGSEENPFREIVSFSNQMPLASAQYGAIEMPLLEGLYPSPNVVYSKVTVRSIHRKGTHADSTVRSGIGKQVTEFFTAKDYPSYSSFTPMNTIDYDKNPFLSLFYKEIINRRTISQGFLVETNDMHGKIKSQMAYSEGDENTPLSASYHTYKNTGKNGLNDQVDFVYNNQSGAVVSGNMGVDMELMTDVREYSVKSNGLNGQGQVDVFLIPIPIPFFLPIPTYFPLKTYVENIYRAVTCTKLINYHAIDDSVIVMDKGSVVSTKSVAYDAETGMPIVTKTANEFNDPIYTVTYPAYWAYSGVGLAYKNINSEFSGVNFDNGKISLSQIIQNASFESGDELYITVPGAGSPGCVSESENVKKLWAYDTTKNATALTVTNKNFLFLDEKGNPYNKSGVGFRILRSGKRNNIGLSLSNATCMKNPIQGNVLTINNAANIVSASAVAYKENWQVDNDVMEKKLYSSPPCSTIETVSVDCSGILEKNINPYVKGLVGNLKPYRSYTYYGSRNEREVTIPTIIRKNGHLNNFSNYWAFDGYNNLVPDYTNQKWVWNSELTKVNSRGQELETKDALNRYTAAQFGFNKNMAVALVHNARYGESFSEGFEDANYAETLNGATLNNCSNNKYFSLNGLPNGTINSTENSTIKTHTGKYALKVNSNAQVSKSLDVLNVPVSDAFNFNFKNDTSKSLNTTGGDFTFHSSSGSYWNTASGDFYNSDFIINVYPSASNFHQYSGKCSTYIKITTAQMYNFNLSQTSRYNSFNDIQSYSNNFQVGIYDINNNKIHSKLMPYSPGIQSYNNAYSVFLCPGIYLIAASFGEMYYQTTNYSDSHNSYSWNCSNCQSLDYKNLSTQNGCIKTLPIPATDNMLNQSFALVPGKRMQFSAWVKEGSDSLINYRPAYLKNHVELQFSGGNSTINFYPKGNIIEGWEKIEGEFTVPSNATSANLVLSNDGSQPVYFDDIRIHPFNANMKSYVYDPRTLRLSAELDENNYASFYEYDEEGQLVRVKKETIQGVKTIKETRSAKQKSITDVQ